MSKGKEGRTLQPKILLTSTNIPQPLYDELVSIVSDRDRIHRIRGLLNTGYLAERIMAGAIPASHLMGVNPGYPSQVAPPPTVDGEREPAPETDGSVDLGIPAFDLASLFAGAQVE